MTVRELLASLPTGIREQAVLATNEALDVPCTGLAYDSRKAKRGSVFVALPGQKADGASFAPQAVASGAVAVVSERQRPAGVNAPWIVVQRTTRPPRTATA